MRGYGDSWPHLGPPSLFRWYVTFRLFHAPITMSLCDAVQAPGDFLKRGDQRVGSGDAVATSINSSTRVLRQIGRASCRESWCQYVYISVCVVHVKKKHNILKI